MKIRIDSVIVGALEQALYRKVVASIKNTTCYIIGTYSHPSIEIVILFLYSISSLWCRWRGWL